MKPEKLYEEGEKWRFDLPLDWDVRRLKHLALKVGSGVTPSGGAENYPDEGVFFIRSQNVHFSGLQLEDVVFIDEETHKSMSNSAVRYEDVLLNITGASIGRCCIFDRDNLPANVNQHVCIIRSNGQIVPNFLRYVLRSNIGQDQIWLSQNGSSREGLNFTDLKAFKLPFPALNEQRNVADFLDKRMSEIDTLIEKKRRLLELLAEQRAALITNAVTKGLDADAAMKDSGIDWLGKVPSHWNVVAFKWRCTVASGQVDPTEDRYASLPLVAPDFIEAGTGRLFPTPSAEEQGAVSGKYFFEVGALLYSKIRPLLSKVCIAPTDGLCSADMYPIIPSADIDTKFLFYQLLSQHFTSFAVMESLRVAMPKVNREALGSFPLLIPPIDEQIKIVQMIDALWEKIDTARHSIEKAIDRLTEYRSALITSAVTGKIKVT